MARPILALTCAGFLLLAGCSPKDDLGKPVETQPQRVAIMIHGAGGGGWEWDLWKDVFEAEGWKVVAPDLMPAAGGLAETAFEDYVAQVQEWTSPYDKPVLIGASLGGILALAVADEIDEGAVVLVNSVPPAVAMNAGETPKEVPEVIKWANGPLQDSIDSMPDSDEATIQKAHKLWRDESGKVIRAVRAGVEVGKPDNPVLVVIGEADTDILPETSRKVADAYGAEVLSYPGMSHVGPLLGTKAKDVARDVLKWLSP